VLDLVFLAISIINVWSKNVNLDLVQFTQVDIVYQVTGNIAQFDWLYRVLI